jgi:hypothetical protein
MKEVAASMGADGLIGVHWCGESGALIIRSGLAVKWLRPGESPRPVAKPCVVAVLPMNENPKVWGDQASLTKEIRRAAAAPLESRGYYVFPADRVRFKAGLAAAKELTDQELAKLGDDAQLLMEVAPLSKAEANIIVGAQANAQMRTILMDKRTRKDVFQGTGSGFVYLGWLLNLAAGSMKLEAAAGIATAQSLQGLGAISEKVPEKKG